ncbi:MAG: ABC-type transport system involved in multi-copper enzyme maturation, permease component [halophilic archaeon J07HX64]|jgi:ABC-type transport system involved in multi-copper enzyme maturation, permease component|nr:MAG: ABC-type transport system involved in multi-copper enzyme maturation, permease component [halophilic archaeon J07HX64]
MTWQTVAKKDIKDSVRSRGLWGIIVIFLALILVLSFLLSPGGDGDETLLVSAGLSFFLGILFFVPLAGLFISIKSIVREKESGSINLLLSLPHTRLDMLLGKFVGRAVVLTVAILAAFGPASIYLLAVGSGSGVYPLFALLISIIFFGLIFIGVGIGLSALVNSETQALVAGVAIFFLLYLWVPILGQLGIDAPDIIARFWLVFMFFDFFLVLLSLTNGSIDSASIVRYDDIVVDEGFDTITIPSQDIWLQHWFVFVILAIWIVVPLGVGYLRFKRQDL